MMTTVVLTSPVLDSCEKRGGGNSSLGVNREQSAQGASANKNNKPTCWSRENDNEGANLIRGSNVPHLNAFGRTYKKSHKAMQPQ